MSEAQQVVVEDQTAQAEEVTTDSKVDDKKKNKRASVNKPSDPVSKFSGDGVAFRAKLFGTAEVREPRGDAICLTAMNLLKAAVKSTGEHKQRVMIKINLSGITLVDLMNQQKIYEHPVNKISFIHKDPQDNRAFGYIVTEAPGKHVYFGIKTEKASEQVIIALKGLFETVFDLKKKEAEMKGKPVGEPTTNGTAVASPAQTAAVEHKVEQTSDKTDSKEESLLGADASSGTNAQPQKELKSQDSQSHLLDLLDNLSFVEQTAPAAASQPSSGVSSTMAWNSQPSNAMMSSGWGNAVPTQNDPFVVQQQQQMQPTNLFSQQQQQTQPTNLFGQQQQMQPTSMFGQQQQPFPQPAYQQQPSPFQSMAQPQPVFQSAATNSPFAPQPAQTMYNPGPAQPFINNFPAFQQQPQVTATGSPFPISQPQQPAMSQQQTQQPLATQQSNVFGNDPFATNGFHSANQQPSAQQSTNPFASTGDQSFGILQPQPVPQPAAVPAHAANPSVNLFSDLNPLPTDSSNVRKDQFFNDVKNPPKPKLSEIPSAKAMSADSTTNNSNSLFHTSPLDELLGFAPLDNSNPTPITRTSQSLDLPLCSPDISRPTLSSLPKNDCNSLLPKDDYNVNASAISDQSGTELQSDLFSELFSLAPNNSSQIPATSQHDSTDFAWLDQQQAVQPTVSNTNGHTTKQGLISPPPRSLRQRQGVQGPASVLRPH